MKQSIRWVFWCVMLAALGLAVSTTPALAGGNANFVLGLRGLDKDFWEPVEDQGAFGVTVDFGKEGWPVNLEIGAFGSGADDELFDSTLLIDVDVKGGVGELTFGVNKTWKPQGNVRPFIGGGVASVTAKAEFDTPIGDVDDDDNSFGLYFHGGVYWRIGSRFNLGIDGRIMGGTDITLFDTEGDADYAQLGLILGWGWPANK